MEAPTQGAPIEKDNLLPEGFATLAEAFAAAETEIGVAAPIVTEATPQVADVESTLTSEQAEATVDEQPDDVDASISEVDEDLQALLDEDDAVEDEAEPEPVADPVAEFVGSDDFWATEVEVDGPDGPTKATLRELYEGHLRQSDYTKKTQELAAQKATLTDAEEFYQAFLDDTAGFAAAIALKAGYISEGDNPRTVDIPQWKSAEQVEAEIEARVAARIAEDPSIQSAKVSQQRAAVESTFAAIERERGVTLSEDRRAAILSEAIESQTTNLALVFDAQVGRARDKARRAAEAKRAAPSKVSSTNSPNQPPKVDAPRTVAEAMEQARRQLAVAQ